MLIDNIKNNLEDLIDTTKMAIFNLTHSEAVDLIETFDKIRDLENHLEINCIDLYGFNADEFCKTLLDDFLEESTELDSLVSEFDRFSGELCRQCDSIRGLFLKKELQLFMNEFESIKNNFNPSYNYFESWDEFIETLEQVEIDLNNLMNVL